MKTWKVSGTFVEEILLLSSLPFITERGHIGPTLRISTARPSLRGVNSYMPLIIQRLEAFILWLQPKTERKREVRKDEGRIMGDGRVTSWVESGEKGISVL